MESWVVSEVAGIKIAFFFPFLTQLEPISWPQEDLNMEFIKKILIFNLLEKQKLYYYQVCHLETDLLK